MAGKTVVFGEHHIPALQAGEYAITVAQYLHNKNPRQPDGRDRINPETSTETKRFAVRGPRFTLDAGDCVSLFPPANNEGEYHNALPHVVLSRPALPWMRSPDGTGGGCSWLAVLTFDVEDPQHPAPALQTIQVGDLFRADFARDPSRPALDKSTLPADAVSYAEGFAASKLPFGLEYGQRLDDRCEAIDVPLTWFLALAPRLEELRWLSHVRSVATADKAGQPAAPAIDYAVVIGNRLPAANRRCTAHLVSLEGMAAFLPQGDSYQAPPIVMPGTAQPVATIRLVSLANWSFTSNDPKQTFEQRLQNIDTGALAVPVTGATPKPGTPEAIVANALQMGYTAADHRTRQGDTTVSWYRGPLLPYQPPSSPLVPPTDPPSPSDAIIGAADQLVRYDPGTGMMDVSYAVAWQLGRLLALQNRSFAIALYNWKRGVAQKTARAVEHRLIARTFGEVLPAVTAQALDEHGVAAVHRAAGSFIATRLHTALGSRASIGEAARLAGEPVHEKKHRRPRGPLVPRRRAFGELAELVSSPVMLANLHAATTVDDEVEEWLARLRVLSGVPLTHLVPDERALPLESLRFFYVDPNWIDSLVQGAYSIGRSTTADANHDRALSATLHGAARARARRLRSPAHAQAEPNPAATGLLMRSSIVSGWPGIEVRAFGADNVPLTNVLRHERLGANIILFMVEGVIDHVDISEPPEGLHFGVDLTAQKSLRYITVPAGAPPHAQPGNEIDRQVKSAGAVPYRDNRVIKVHAFAQQIEAAITDVHANNDPAIGGPPRQFTPAEFAVEMVEGVQSVRFFHQQKAGS